MDDSTGLQKVTVTGQEKRGGEAGILAASELGVREGKPDFGDFAGTEEGVDELDAGAEEGDIAHGFLRGFLGAFPQARALDVDPDKVHLRMAQAATGGHFDKKRKLQVNQTINKTAKKDISKPVSKTLCGLKISISKAAITKP